MAFSIKDFFSKCDHIRRKLQIWSHLLKKSLMENFIFCAAWLSFKHQNIVATSNQRKAHNIEISLILSFKALHWKMTKRTFKILRSSHRKIFNLAVRTSQDFKIMFGHFSTICMKGLKEDVRTYWKDAEQMIYTRIFKNVLFRLW